MFELDISREALADQIRGMSENDFARFIYCQHMIATFMSVNKLEHMIIEAMLMCDRITVKNVIKKDLKAWERLLTKRAHLLNSTLGTLVKILDDNGIDPGDIAYLKWIKEKRDKFVHRWFNAGAWPGDLNAPACRFHTRRLAAIQIWLSRAEIRIWYILQKAGLVHVIDLKTNGILAMNADLPRLLNSPDPE